jgi:phage shock protein C
MQNVQPSLFHRDDTMLGVCQGLGEDFGFNPLFLRAAIPLPLFFYPVETVGGYLVAGMVVLLSRLLAPNPRISGTQREDRAAIVEQYEGSTQQPMPLAA